MTLIEVLRMNFRKEKPLPWKEKMENKPLFCMPVRFIITVI